MSWLNFNDSLNNIKGQLSTFANTVLAENLQGSDAEASNIVDKSESHKETRQTESFRGQDVVDSSWTWSTDESKTDQLKTDETITNLKKKIIELENENRELITSLDQLDQNYQQNTEEVVKIKEKLSEELEIVTEKYEILNTKYNKLALAENAYKKKINELKSKCENLSKNSTENAQIQELQEENKALRIALCAKKDENSGELQEVQKNLEASQNSIEKVKEILKDYAEDINETTENIAEQLSKTLCKFEEKFNELESKIFEITQAKTDLQNEKNAEIEKLLENSEMLTQELLTKSKDIKYLEEECEQLMKNNEIMNEKLQENSHVQLQTIFESNEDNAAILEAAHGQIEELEELRTRLQKTESERDELRKNLEKTRADFESSEYQFTEMKISFENLCEELNKHKTRIDTLENEKLNLSTQKGAQILEFELKIKQLEQQLQEKESEIGAEEKVELRTKLEEVEAELKVAKESLDKLQENHQNEIKILEQQLEIAKEKRVETETEENVMLKSKIEEVEAELKRAKENLSKNEEKLKEIGTVKSRNSELEKFTEELRNKCGKYYEENEIFKCEISQISEELGKIKTEHSNLSNFREKMALLLGETDEEPMLNRIKTMLEKPYSELSSNELDELIKSRNEMISILQVKHQESLTYHEEIQRLTRILREETEKNIELEKQLESSSTIQAKLDNSNDQIEFLREKCEILTNNLLETEKRSSEKEANLTKKLERLQTHLMEIEEHYTQELLEAEQKTALLQAKLNEVEQREKDSSTIYTSVSIRANQQNEALQVQLQTLTAQRDEFKSKLLELEDENNIKSAALTNLQLVLEQFQRDKEADVIRETERIRKQVKTEQKIQDELRKEIASLQDQIKENKQGLQAASRLSDQLENTKTQLSNLKEEVAVLNEKLAKKDEELQRVSGQTEGKVDKSLIKNLIIGFVTSNKNLNRDQTQILKIIATVLDFNEQDHSKVNLNQAQHNSWLRSLLTPSSDEDLPPHESLSKAFVNFLEAESKPRVIPSLLQNDSMGAVADSTSSVAQPSTSNSRRSSRTTPSPIVLNEIVLPTFSDFPQHRNSSSILKGVLKTNNNN